MQDYKLMRWVPWVGAILMASACTTTVPAPVESRTSSAAVAVAAPAQAATPRPGYHIVKPGETLYSISHQYERDYRTIAEWNEIADPAVIKVGQEIRVVPLTELGGARPVESGPVLESLPVAGAPRLESVPVGTGSAPAVVAVSPVAVPVQPVGGRKTEPKGGRVAYSAEAWKDLTQPPSSASAPVATVSAPAVKPPVPAVPPVASSVPVAEQTVNVAGELSWSWPGGGRIVGTFNDSTNKGVDLSGNVGDPVLAAANGRVVYVGSGLRGYGNLVIVKHNDTYLSAYAHNSEVLVKEGQAVQRGQKIAALGSSDADRPKLHFEIRRQGKPVDPLKYLPTR